MFPVALTLILLLLLRSVSELFAPPGSLASADEPLSSPILVQGFRGLEKSRVLVVSGGCEALAGDIARQVCVKVLRFTVLVSLLLTSCTCDLVI